MLEKKIEQKLRNEIKKMGGMAYKFVSPGNSGVPDRIVMLPGGKIIFVELKIETGKTTQLQEMQIDKIRNLGFDVRVLKGIKQVEDFINEIRSA